MRELKVVNVTFKLAVPQDVDVDDLASNMDYNMSYKIDDEEVIIDTEMTNVVGW
jgi:hypothetical protein